MSDINDNNQKTLEDTPKSLVSHLSELRDRVLRVMFVLLLTFVCLLPFANEIYTFASEPLRALLPEGSTMIATEVASPFLTPFKLTLVLAVFIVIPFILFQVWAFVAPGMYKREKKIILPLLASSVALFYAGVAFAYYVVFPIIFAFFTRAGPVDVTVMTDINRYLNFVFKLFFAFGVAFEVPVAVLILTWSGIATPDTLAKKRPYIVVSCFIVGMLLTPPDVISQALLAIPMWMLFEFGIFLARMIKHKKEPCTV